jgi:hypothetical protein
MQHMRGVLQFILERHEPYGAIVIDRYSNLLMANSAAKRLFGALVPPSLLAGQPNVLRIVFHPEGVRRWIVNWQDVARSLMTRVERDFDPLKDDPIAAKLLAELREQAGGSARTSLVPPGAADLFLSVHIRRDNWEIRMFSAIMTLGTPQDITLQELRIETFFPADPDSESRLRAMTGVR